MSGRIFFVMQIDNHFYLCPIQIRFDTHLGSYDFGKTVLPVSAALPRFSKIRTKCQKSSNAITRQLGSSNRVQLVFIFICDKYLLINFVVQPFSLREGEGCRNQPRKMLQNFKEVDRTELYRNVGTHVYTYTYVYIIKITEYVACRFIFIRTSTEVNNEFRSQVELSDVYRFCCSSLLPFPY